MVSLIFFTFVCHYVHLVPSHFLHQNGTKTIFVRILQTLAVEVFIENAKLNKCMYLLSLICNKTLTLSLISFINMLTIG